LGHVRRFCGHDCPHSSGRSWIECSLHHARFHVAQQTARSTWGGIIGRNPLLGVKALRLLEPGTYAWLYRNDRDWLERKKSLALRASSEPRRRTLWDARDRDLAESVKLAGARLATEFPSGPIRLWQIHPQIPDLKAKLAQLDRLPLTVEALMRFVRTRSR